MSEKTFPKPGDNSETSSLPLASDEASALEDPVAVAHEAKVRLELNAQFRELKRQAQGVFEAVKGRVGARNEQYLEQVFAKAREEYATGQFLMQRLGAERQLDLPLVATLTQLRLGLLDGVDHPTAADHMLADAAVLAYRNLLRVQGWLGSLCLEFERELFGQENHTDYDLREIESILCRIQEKILPMQERCERMLLRALNQLDARKLTKVEASITIGSAGQVNVG